jgi:hypothetical protein
LGPVTAIEKTCRGQDGHKYDKNDADTKEDTGSPELRFGGTWLRRRQGTFRRLGSAVALSPGNWIGGQWFKGGHIQSRV